jgi:thioredoxin reductase (NADPH)
MPRTVLLATGVIDIPPPLPDVDQALAAGALRYCPICDGYEATGRRVAVLGHGNSGLQEAIFIRHYSDQVTLCALDEPLHLGPEEKEQLQAAGVRFMPEPVRRIDFGSSQPPRVRLLASGEAGFEADVLYSALGTRVNSGLARALGAECAPNGALLVDAHQQTTVDGLYAAGDVVAGLNQIAVAMGHAAIAATAIHNRLRQGA